MRKNNKPIRSFLALACVALLASCVAKAKEITYKEAKVIATEIYGTTHAEDFKYPSKITGEYKIDNDGNGTSLSFVCDSELFQYHVKGETKYKDVNSDGYIRTPFEKWIYKEGNEYIYAYIQMSYEGLKKVYGKSTEWEPDYTVESINKLEEYHMKLFVETKTEKVFLWNTTFKSIKYSSRGKGSFIVDYVGKEDEQSHFEIRDNLLICVDRDIAFFKDHETYKATYGVAKFKKPNLTDFEFISNVIV